MSLKFIIRKEEELCAVAKMILEKYNSKIFLFYGEMGVGKTSFIICAPKIMPNSIVDELRVSKDILIFLLGIPNICDET